MIYSYSIYDKKISLKKLNNLIKLLEHYYFVHKYDDLRKNHDVPDKLNFHHIKKTIIMHGIRGNNKNKCIECLENNDIKLLIKYLKLLKNQIGMNN